MIRPAFFIILLFASSLFAGPSVLIRDNFNDSRTWDDGWTTQGAVSLSQGVNRGGYVRLGDNSGNSVNKLIKRFRTSESGVYNLRFDYRFAGVDSVGNRIINPSDKVKVYLDIRGPGNQEVFSWNSNGNTLSNQWKATDPPASIYLEGNSSYRLKFYHVETHLDKWGEKKIITEFHLDNVHLWKDGGGEQSAARIVPAPSAILLAGLGTLLVSAYRRRRLA